MMESIVRTHRFSLGGKYGFLCIDKATMAQANRIDFDTDVVLDPVRSVEGVEVVALFKERFDGGVKLSLRATNDVDVREVAKSFGGGGHVKAAGATLDQPLAESIELVEAKVRQALLLAGHTDIDP
jgi:phosphoesterase RecJ-like protein